MKKIYVLDTSALISDPNIFSKLQGDITIPIEVVNELDNKKTSDGQVGRNARVAIRAIEEMSNLGDISTGVLVRGALVKVDAKFRDLELELFKGLGSPTYGDTHILACCIDVNQLNPDCETTLVSNDLNLRIKAKSRGVKAVSCEIDEDLTDLYTGAQECVDEDAAMALQKNNTINPKDYGLTLLENEFVSFKSENGDDLSSGRMVDGKLKLVKKIYPWGITPRNKEQSYMIDLIMDKNIDLVSATGIAGTGKTLIAIASALELVINQKQFNRLVIYRPIQAVGNDIGFLPGLLEEKLAPWFQAILDNFEYLFTFKRSCEWKKELDMFVSKGNIEMSALTYIRGRSIANSIMLIDECQNLNKEEIKTILTRTGNNTKVILLGDLCQIDSPKIDAMSSGLSYATESFKGESIAGHITLTKGERSRLASLSANIL